MKKINWIVVSAVLLLGAIMGRGQTVFGIAPAFAPQFFGNNGQPLSGGILYTCTAGLACPGNPQATFSDASGFTANANPILLDASGRPSNGSAPVGIWLNCSQSYKFVLQDSTSVTISTADNLTCTGNGSGGGGGSTTNYWTLSGSAISNNNGSGSGAVSVGSDFTVGNNLFLTGTLNLRDSQPSANYAILRASSVMSADVTWRWPATDAAGCLNSDGAGNLSFIACSGGGGGGTPGGANTNVQYNNTGAFGGSNNFVWSNSGQVLTITAASSGVQGIIVLTGYIQADNGFDAVVNGSPGTARAWNVIQAPTGGMHALSFTADNYIESGSSMGAPTATTSESSFPHAGTLYCDTTSSPCTEQLWDGMNWVALATGGATSPGGSTTNIQYNGAGSFAGSANLTWDNSNQILTAKATSPTNYSFYAQTGYMFSDLGYNVNPSTGTQYNVIQATAGGVRALSGTFSKYVQVGSGAVDPSVTSGDTFQPGTLYYNTSSAQLMAFNGAAFAAVGGGGGGTPGSPTTGVQYNNSGSFAATSNFTWTNSTRTLTINTLSNSVGLQVVNGYAQADVGFLATSGVANLYNAIQAPTGGVAGRSGTFTKYVQTGNNNGIPSVTSTDTFVAGAMFYDTGAGAEKVFNGSIWVPLATGGVISINSLVGALTLVPGAGAGQLSISSVGSTITLTEPQPLGTTSPVTFASVVANGAFNSTVTGLTTGFTVNGGQWLVNGQGDMSGAGSVNMNGSTFTGAYRVNGTIIVDSSRNLINIASLGLSSGGTIIDSSRNLTGVLSMTFTGSISATGGTTSIGPNFVGAALASFTTVSSGTGGFIANGHTGITGSTCSHWTLGICDTP